MNIVKVEPKQNYQLLVHAENGLTGVFDVSPYLEAEAFLALREPKTIRRKITHRGLLPTTPLAAEVTAVGPVNVNLITPTVGRLRARPRRVFPFRLTR